MMLEQFLSGAIVMGFAVACLLFLNYFRKTRKSLFLIFAASFALLSINYFLLAITQIPNEERSFLYVIRLLAFSLIIFAIVRSSKKEGG